MTNEYHAVIDWLDDEGNRLEMNLPPETRNALLAEVNPLVTQLHEKIKELRDKYELPTTRVLYLYGPYVDKTYQEANQDQAAKADVADGPVSDAS